jgi:hypothetical protein
MSSSTLEVKEEADTIEERADLHMEVEGECPSGQEGDSDEEGNVEQPLVKRAKVEQEGSAEEEEEEGSVKEFLTGLSMAYEYHDKKYYTRECFLEYYELVMYLFDNKGKRGVTITGAPGMMVVLYSLPFSL